MCCTKEIAEMSKMCLLCSLRNEPGGRDRPVNRWLWCSMTACPVTGTGDQPTGGLGRWPGGRATRCVGVVWGRHSGAPQGGSRATRRLITVSVDYSSPPLGSWGRRGWWLGHLGLYYLFVSFCLFFVLLLPIKICYFFFNTFMKETWAASVQDPL